MSTTITKTKQSTKTSTSSKIFTRITLDPASLQAVQRVQAALPNYDINDAVKMIFGLGINELDDILPQKDDNGFTAITKSRLLKAKKELEENQGKIFDNPLGVIQYAQNITQ